jgi:hypothetical protein
VSGGGCDTVSSCEVSKPDLIVRAHPEGGGTDTYFGGLLVYQDLTELMSLDFSIFRSQRLKGRNFELGTDCACVACGRILDGNRKLISARRQRNVQMGAQNVRGI